MLINSLKSIYASYRMISTSLIILIITMMHIKLYQWQKEPNYCGSTLISNAHLRDTKNLYKSPYLAYIISRNPENYEMVKNKLETRLPGFFKIYKKDMVEKNDTRMPDHLDINLMSLLFSHVDVWDHVGATSDEEIGENQWIFLFTDDVDIISMNAIDGFYSDIYDRWKHGDRKHSLEGTFFLIDKKENKFQS